MQDKKPNEEAPGTMMGKKTAVFAGGEKVWLLIESSKEDPDAFEFNGTWWRRSN